MVESASGWEPRDPQIPLVLIDSDTDDKYWRSEEDRPGPKEIVLSLFSHAPVLIDRVLFAAGSEQPENPKDVEVSVSPTSPSEGFSRVAAATLSFDNDDKEATGAFSPVQARFVKLRFLKNHGGEEVFHLTELKVMEAVQAGYTPLLTREPELARLTGNAPAAAAPLTPVPATAKATVCSSDAPESAIQPGKSDSRRVLVIDAAGSGNYPPADDTAPDNTGHVETSILKRIHFTSIRPGHASPVLLARALDFDTVVPAQVCDVGTDVPAAFRRALPAWVATGQKLIVHDSDRCRQGPDYSFLPCRFATNNPGALGESGTELRLLEENSIAHARPVLRGFLDVKAWPSGEADCSSELGGWVAIPTIRPAALGSVICW